ncbi:hypothetical protein [Nocardia sp. alder85J]|uniref:hypothetical protein n=1 Tax=Nocardia sp. alder85J TaxID=2862949 RepID=UPI001CD5163F|nr:hypothetical protein [Nocardia sp. alder85J]MCX4098423.1 hypothetical protein [Nocardia sp. alder85J]
MVDRTRYRVVIGEVGQFDRAIRTGGVLRVAGTNSLPAAYAWISDRLAEYADARATDRSAWGARVTVLDIDHDLGTVTVLSSLHGYPEQLRDRATALTSGHAPSDMDTADLHRPYRARFYNAFDSVTLQSPAFATEAAARLWLDNRAEAHLSDPVEATITRLDPTSGWPRPVTELGSDGLVFGAMVSNDLNYLTQADDAFFEALTRQGVHTGTSFSGRSQHSARELFLATLYRDRLAHHDPTAASQLAQERGGAGAREFPLLDTYRMADPHVAAPSWVDALVHRADDERDRTLASSHRIMFADANDPSRLIEVRWQPEQPGASRQGWYATESVDTPDGPRFVVALGRRDTSIALLNMLERPMIGFDTIQPTSRTAIAIPRDRWHEIFQIGMQHSHVIAAATVVARQADTLRKPVGTTATAPDDHNINRVASTEPAFDLWRDGLFPGMRVSDAERQRITDLLGAARSNHPRGLDNDSAAGTSAHAEDAAIDTTSQRPAGTEYDID